MIIKKNRILVLDHLYSITDELKIQFIQLKGKHYNNLKPHPGWTFSIDKLKDLENLLTTHPSLPHQDNVPLTNNETIQCPTNDEQDRTDNLLLSKSDDKQENIDTNSTKANDLENETPSDVPDSSPSMTHHHSPSNDNMIIEKDGNIIPKQNVNVKKKIKRTTQPHNIQFIVNEYKYDIPTSYYEYFNDYIVYVHS